MPEALSQKNKLGLWTSTSLVVGNMIGAGVFLMPTALASYGGISLFGWIFSAIGAFFLAKVFSNLSKLMPHADGGPYAYSRKGFGDFAGFLVAWGYWISIWCANAAIAVSLVSALSTFFPLLATNAVAAIGTGLGAIWLLTWINTLGIVTSGKVQLITTVLKILPLLLVAVGGLFFFRLSNFMPFNTSGLSDFSAITSTATLTFYAFLGIECATIPSGNTINPEKTISQATMLGTLIATIIYILSSASIMGMISAKELQHSVTPFVDAAVMIWGNGAKYWVSAGVAIAAFGALNGWILVQGQVPYAIAKDKLFPAIFKKENKKGVPGWGIVISSILVSVLMSMNYTKGLAEQFKFLILLSTLTVLVPYLFSAAAYIIIRLENKYLKPGVAWIPSLLLATGAFIFSLWAIAGSGYETVYWGFILLMAGVPFYVMMVWKNRSSSQTTTKNKHGSYCSFRYRKNKKPLHKKCAAGFVSDTHIDQHWKALNFLGKPDLDTAIAEYASFEQALKEQGAEIFYFPEDDTVNMDSIYCRDASIATDKGMIICNMGKAARAKEPAAQRKVFEANGITILGTITAPGTVEGGDVAWLDEKTLAVGHTYRTNEEGIRQLTALLQPLGVEVIAVPLPHYKGESDVFHLMSILSPVDKDLAVVYSPLMPIVFRNLLLQRGYRLVEVPDEEFESMGCNVLAVSPCECLMVDGNPKTKKGLEEAGCKVTVYKGEEISVKGGGGPTCLTRPIYRMN